MSNVLSINNLNVSYGSSQALHNVNLELGDGIHAVLGRNGVGKTTLCNAIMGLVPASGSITYKNTDLLQLAPHRRCALGIAYTPQGRRLWKSLSVDEHLRLSEVKNSSWSVERIYATFPRLRERSKNSAAQLSGGEQQMVAIARALMKDPELLIFDEPTEGLAPVIVEQLEELMLQLAEKDKVSILLVEQNVSVATRVAKDVAIIINGDIRVILPTKVLAGDRELQQNLLGVGVHTDLDAYLDSIVLEDSVETKATGTDDAYPTHWGGGFGGNTNAGTAEKVQLPFDQPVIPMFQEMSKSLTTNITANKSGEALVVGTFSTKATELNFLRDQLRTQGLRVKTVDVSTTGEPADTDVSSSQVASYHPQGASHVFTGDRGSAIKEMSLACKNWIKDQHNVIGIISAGGSGNTVLATSAMRSLPLGIPKVMISTVASGEVSQYIGSADIMMMHSVTDVQGLNVISTSILGNGANALAGMINNKAATMPTNLDTKPILGMTMFGVTTIAVQHVMGMLEEEFECLVFHATGIGGQSMEKLADNGMLTAALDLTTTEVCDFMFGGVFPATEDRFGAFIRNPLPYVVSLGALDMVNFGARNTIPAKYANRLLYEHNQTVTLMRTTPDENAKMGAWIAERLNQVSGPMRLLIPEQGLSALDTPGQPFYDPAANEALFSTLKEYFITSDKHKITCVPSNINDPLFARNTVDALKEVMA